MVPRSPLIVALLVGIASAMQVQTIDMYRAQGTPKLPLEFPMESNNLADIPGTLQYIQQEILPEHAQEPARTARKYGVDSIVHFRMKVLNTPALLASPTHGTPGFGAYASFDYGLTANLDSQQHVVSFGDQVGLEAKGPTSIAGDLPMQQIAYDHPWYWYSVSGFCPNLPWKCIKGSLSPACLETEQPTVPSGCEQGCEGKPLAQGKVDTSSAAYKCVGSPGFKDPKDETKKDYDRTCCLNYDAGSGGTGVVQGGRCPAGTDTPTGKNGCVYTYADVTQNDVVSLDEIVGITTMLCGDSGERTCTNWTDWRKNCHEKEKYNKAFEKVTDAQGVVTVNVVTTDFCVEYDQHPTCEDKGCADPDCQAIPFDQVEFGLPFWKGKCDVAANLRRAEEIASLALPIGVLALKSHTIIDSTVANPACNEEIRCKPNGNGEPYCTRQWAGVCSTCQIPGVKRTEEPSILPLCPYTIAKEPGNAPPQSTTCVSNLPIDLCCLYGVSQCQETSDVGINDFLLAHVASAKAQSFAPMASFLEKFVIAQGGKLTDKEGFEQFAYKNWGHQPPANVTTAFLAFTREAYTLSGIDWSGSGHGPSPPSPPAPPGSGKTFDLTLPILLFFGGTIIALCLVIGWIQQRAMRARAPSVIPESAAERGTALQLSRM